jgi:SAM-dependent methyltransferase
MWEASMANHARYLDHNTGKFHQKHLEDRNCPACGHAESRYLLSKSGGTYVVCSECDMVFLNPALKDSELIAYYTTNHSVQSEIVASDEPFYRNLYETGLGHISSIINRSGIQARRILDVGCSSGSFLNIAREQGWQTFGLELNDSEIKAAIRAGHQVLQTTIERASFEERFEAITLWDVFEHIKDGLSFLSATRRLLAPGGLVFIQSPSRDSLAARVMREHCNMFDGLEHVNLYGENQLSVLAQRAGFRVVHYSCVISEVGVMNNFLNYEDPYSGTSTDTTTLLGALDGEQILKMKLGYKFQACLSLI